MMLQHYLSYLDQLGQFWALLLSKSQSNSAMGYLLLHLVLQVWIVLPSPGPNQGPGPH